MSRDGPMVRRLGAGGRRIRTVSPPSRQARGLVTALCQVAIDATAGEDQRRHRPPRGRQGQRAIDAAGLAQTRDRFALLGRDVSQLSDDQLRNLVGELERRFRDEALTSAAQAATIILDGVKADRWRILVGADAHKIDEMVRQSPERAYDIAFFDEFARAAGWTERLSLENPELRPLS